MIKRMLTKCQKQEGQIEDNKREMERWEECSSKNSMLREELLELKELMKGLLLQRE